MNLSDKDICQLRLECLKLYVPVVSKWDIEKDIVIEKAKIAFDFITETIKTTDGTITATLHRRGRPAKKF